MQYYAIINNNKISGRSTCPVSGKDIESIGISQEVYNDIEHYIYSDGEIIFNQNYDIEQAEKREAEFKKEFFETSLGWIRRQPTLADGTLDDFLNNDLPLLAIALMSGGSPVLPIAYELPDFTQELTKEYMETLQIKDQAITPQFINECSLVKMKDFKG